MKQAVIASLPLAALFFTGWSFLSAYLGSFGIDITEVDLALQTVLVFAFRPLHTYLAGLVAVMGTVVIYIVFFWHRSVALQKKVHWLFWVTPTLILVIGFLALNELAKQTAKTAANQVWNGKRVRVEAILTSTEEARRNLIVADYRECRSRRRFVNVFSTVSKSYLLCPSSNEPDKSGMLYVVENTGIISSRRRIGRQP